MTYQNVVLIQSGITLSLKIKPTIKRNNVTPFLGLQLKVKKKTLGTIFSTDSN